MDRSDTIAALGAVAAGATQGQATYAIDMRSGDHWVQLAGFLTKRDARAAIAMVVSQGAEGGSLRIRKLASRA